MDGSTSPLFAKARTALEPFLAQMGFTLAEEHYHHQDFGSVYAVYKRRGIDFRLIWDGKESWVDWDCTVEGMTPERHSGAPIRLEAEIPRLLDDVKSRLRL